MRAAQHELGDRWSERRMRSAKRRRTFGAAKIERSARRLVSTAVLSSLVARASAQGLPFTWSVLPSTGIDEPNIDSKTHHTELCFYIFTVLSMQVFRYARRLHQ